MRILAYVLGLYMMSNAYGEDQKIIYQYKKYEKFDLGNLEVKGH